MNGAQHNDAGIGSSASNWHIIGTGDFNGDARADLLWRSDSGQVGIWQMNGAQRIDLLPGASTTNWHILGTGDFNGDGRSDILWRTITARSASGS